MPDKFMKTRVLGTLDIDTDEAKKDIAQKIKLAARGAFPYAVREMMKKSAWQILSSDNTSDADKESAKLMICYSWWARALENEIPARYFEEFILDHLAYLDSDRQSKIPEKWQKYG